MPYRPWVIGAFGFFGLAVIFVCAVCFNLEIHPYKNTSLFWLVSQFSALCVVTIFFRSAILNLQINIYNSTHRLLSIQEDIDDIKQIMSKTESQKLEYKASFRYDYKQNKTNTDLSIAIIKSIAGFMNCEGGALILGIDDNGVPLGLDKDYLTLKKKNSDGFELAVVQAVSESIGAEMCQNLKFNFLTVQEKEVCVIHICKSVKPVYVETKDQSYFYIRTGNSTQQLDTKRAIEYIQTHWTK